MEKSAKQKKRPGFGSTVYASYLGYITQAVVNNLAPLLFVVFQEELNLTLSQITLITTINFLVQLTVDLLSVWFVDRIGYRVSIVAAHLFSVLGLMGMAVLPSVLSSAYAGLLLSAVLYAVGGGLIEVLISPIVEACPAENKAAAMSLLHSFYCWGTVSVVLLSTLFLHFFGKQNWRILPLAWALLPLFNAFWFSRVPINRLTEKNEGMKAGGLFRSGFFWLLVLLMISAGASEQAVSQWASALAEKGLNLSKTVGDLAGPCFFSILMGISRAIFGKRGDRMDLEKYLIFSSALCVLSYLIIVFAPSPALSLLGCGICGFAVGIMWPGVFSVSAASLPRGGTAMFALLALAGDVGCSSGPTVVGLVAAGAGDDLKTGILTAVIFPVLILSGLIALRKKRSVSVC